MCETASIPRTRSGHTHGWGRLVMESGEAARRAVTELQGKLVGKRGARQGGSLGVGDGNMNSLCAL